MLLLVLLLLLLLLLYYNQIILEFEDLCKYMGLDKILQPVRQWKAY